jgi:hypothetical protein
MWRHAWSRAGSAWQLESTNRVLQAPLTGHGRAVPGADRKHWNYGWLLVRSLRLKLFDCLVCWLESTSSSSYIGVIEVLGQAAAAWSGLCPLIEQSAYQISTAACGWYADGHVPGTLAMLQDVTYYQTPTTATYTSTPHTTLPDRVLAAAQTNPCITPNTSKTCQHQPQRGRCST